MMWSSPALILNTSLSLLTSIFYLGTLNQAEVEWSTCCRAPSAEQERNYRVRGGKRRVHGGCGGTVCGVCLCMCVLLISEAFVSTRAVVPHVDLLTKWFLSLSLSADGNWCLPASNCEKNRLSEGPRGGAHSCCPGQTENLLSRPDTLQCRLVPGGKGGSHLKYLWIKMHRKREGLTAFAQKFRDVLMPFFLLLGTNTRTLFCTDLIPWSCLWIGYLCSNNLSNCDVKTLKRKQNQPSLWLCSVSWCRWFWCSTRTSSTKRLNWTALTKSFWNKQYVDVFFPRSGTLLFNWLTG